VHPLIQSALKANVDKNEYLPSAGLPELRLLARDYFANAFGFHGEDYDVIIGPGSKELLFDVQMVVDGDLLLPVPSWVSYAPQAMLTQDRVIKIPTVIAENHHITAERLENAILIGIREGNFSEEFIFMTDFRLVLIVQVNLPRNEGSRILILLNLHEIVHVLIGLLPIIVWIYDFSFSKWPFAIQ